MKTYRVLKDFEGSQRGYTPTERFKAGEEVELHDHLAEVALEHGYVAAIGGTYKPEETKVIVPEEAKVIAPEEQKKPTTKLTLNKKS